MSTSVLSSHKVTRDPVLFVTVKTSKYRTPSNRFRIEKECKHDHSQLDRAIVWRVESCKRLFGNSKEMTGKYNDQRDLSEIERVVVSDGTRDDGR